MTTTNPSDNLQILKSHVCSLFSINEA